MIHGFPPSLTRRTQLILRQYQVKLPEPELQNLCLDLFNSVGGQPFNVALDTGSSDMVPKIARRPHVPT
jgi:hypothetical protein